MEEHLKALKRLADRNVEDIYISDLLLDIFDIILTLHQRIKVLEDAHTDDGK